MSSSLNGILSVAKTGLLTQQLALQVTSHNLANATTEGYSRQRAELVPGIPVLLPEGLVGTGVRVADITRARDQLLDGIYRRESALFHGFQTQYQGLSSVESAFGEIGATGLGDSLDAFWDAWSDLANDPTSSAARSVVVSNGQALVDHFRRIDGTLDTVIGQEVDRLRNSVGLVNDILDQVAGLNVEIAAVRASGTSAPDLEDRRDVLLDQLSTYVP
ncbi:MAG: flagellar hook-associated protein FlgK, partial [Gemmatimonadetes bacterium]|nr:flagellar hook-associated protein FlgK [Gemmatimonadota bacterium]